MIAATLTDTAQIGEILQQMQLAQYQQRALCGCIIKHGNYQNTTTKLLFQRIFGRF
jgi:hypothetical protein